MLLNTVEERIKLCSFLAYCTELRGQGCGRMKALLVGLAARDAADSSTELLENWDNSGNVLAE